MTTPLLQGEPTIARMCALAGVSRAGYYRNWAASAPRQEETALRDMVQRVALAEKHYGYRRVTVELRRAGVCVNHKRVLRLMREDNLLCLRRRTFVPATTDSNHGWRVVPNLTYGIVLTGIDQLWAIFTQPKAPLYLASRRGETSAAVQKFLGLVRRTAQNA